MPEPISSQRSYGASRTPEQSDPSPPDQTLPATTQCEERPAPVASEGFSPAEEQNTAGVDHLVKRRRPALETALLKGSTREGEAYEVGAVKLEAGDQNEAGAALYRRSGQTPDGKLGVTSELGSARIAVGTQNGECRGFNVGAQGSLAQSEWTLRSGASGEDAMTLGISAGAGAEIGICEQDSDRDGRAETCVRISAGPVTYAQCLEAEPEAAPPRSDFEMGTGGASGR